MKTLIANSLQQSFSYFDYRKKVFQLLSEGKSSGKEQSSDLLHYSELNEVRMSRLEKTLAVPDEIAAALSSLNRKYIWLVLAEGWCGDAAQVLPVLHKMDAVSEQVDLQIVFRDENEPLMQEFLTNGARSIPKMVVLSAGNNEVVAAWGPRPEGAARLIKEFKAKYGVVNEEAKIALQKWYLHDKGLTTMTEIVKLMQSID